MKNVETFKQQVIKNVRKFSWVDLIGICVFLGILSAAFFFFLRKADYAYITLRVSQSDNLNTYVNQAPIWYVEKIQPGIKETDSLGNDSIVLEKVHRFRSSDLNQDLYVDLKVKSVYNTRTGQYSYNGSPLLIGSFQSFKLQSLLLYGTVVDVHGPNETSEEKTFIVKGYVDPTSDKQYDVANTVVDGIRNYIADTLEKGLQVTDSDGTPTAEVLSIQKTEGRRRFVSGSNFVSVPDPERQRVEMTVKLKGTKINDAYYYRKESALVVNTPLYLTFPKSSVLLIITSIEEAKN